MISRRAASLVAIVIGVIVAWWQAVWRFVDPNWPHPSIKRFSTFSLDAGVFRQQIEAGDPVDIQLGERSLQLHLEPASVQDDECTVIDLTEDGEVELEPPDETAYRGTVVGTEESTSARLGVGDVSVSGYVMLEDEWWFIEPLARYRLDADPGEHIAYRIQDTQFRLDFGEDTISRNIDQGGDDDEHDGNEPSNGQGVTDGGAERLGIVCVADREFVDRATRTDRLWQHHQQQLISMVNEIFERESGRTFQIKYFLRDRRGDLSSTDPDTLLAQLETTAVAVLGDLRSPTRRQELNIEAVHLTTGKNLDGNTIGIAFRPGVFGLSQYRIVPFSWPFGWPFGWPFLEPPVPVQVMLTVTHELGHNFNGIHDEADEWCKSRFLICWDKVRTLMWPTIFNDNVRRFSDGTRNSSHNNRQRIRLNMTTGRNRRL